MDVQGILGIDEKVRNGFDGIKVHYDIDAEQPPQRPAPTEVDAPPTLGMELGRDIRTVVWATGFRPDHSWLDLPQAFDRHGALLHDRGVVAPGLVVLGLPFLRRRKSSFIHGAEDDVRELLAHLIEHLDRTARRGVSLSIAAA
jgi:putative flavoprotein involved in K+ transport